MKQAMPSLAFVFPGQGSQKVGMLSSLAQREPVIKATFDECSLACDLDLWTISQNTEDELNKTQITQPALLAAAIALWRLWQSKGGAMPNYLAGHSLGEYAALVAAEAIALEDAARLVHQRGLFMQQAVPMGVGAMAAVLGLDNDQLQQVCNEAQQNEVVAPVNFNAIGQTVIAGHKAAVERAANMAKERGAKKVILLPVSVPSHCALMEEAGERLAQALNQVAIHHPKRALLHNYDVSVCEHPDDIRARLVAQLSHPVRWVETIQEFASLGVTRVVECGPGKVLSGLIKRTEPSLATFALESTELFDVALSQCQ